MTKQEIERERNKWVLRVLLAFIVIVVIMISAEKVIRFFVRKHRDTSHIT